MKKKYKKPKKTKEHLMKHTKKRVLERYSFDLTDQVFHCYNKLIQSDDNRVFLLDIQSNTRKLYIIDDIYFIYNTKLKSICTCITEEMYKRQQNWNGADLIDLSNEY
jgi:hypothetical protein